MTMLVSCNFTMISLVAVMIIIAIECHENVATSGEKDHRSLFIEIPFERKVSPTEVCEYYESSESYKDCTCTNNKDRDDTGLLSLPISEDESTIATCMVVGIECNDPISEEFCYRRKMSFVLNKMNNITAIRTCVDFTSTNLTRYEGFQKPFNPKGLKFCSVFTTCDDPSEGRCIYKATVNDEECFKSNMCEIENPGEGVKGVSLDCCNVANNTRVGCGMARDGLYIPYFDFPDNNDNLDDECVAVDNSSTSAMKRNWFLQTVIGTMSTFALLLSAVIPM